MNDDYLWDRSGEPDPEVERLERVLGKYRYQAKPLSPALRSQLAVRRGGWIKFAAVAAAILVVLAGFWIFKTQNKVINTNRVSEAQTLEKQVEKQAVPPEKQALPPMKENTEVAPSLATAPKPRRKIDRRAGTETTVERSSIPGSDTVAARQPMINPFVDVETARHIERAQLLLRAFRNTRDTSAQPDSDVSYERQHSRALLSNNILLRREAEAKGNIPVEELLGSLEPFLLDIANLPDRPSNAEVRSIKERMQKKEIVSALQVYSMPLLSQVF
ncbi:MAG TPA: hypothetical protein VFF31_13550 [Blastocatellia bacterium]|nr:hypothetical protein [Blastocatellia bacterium]